MLVDNPILMVRWEATTSAWTQDGGLTRPFANRLRAGGIDVARFVNAVPPGSVSQHAGVSRGTANNINGAAAEAAITRRLAAQGFATTQTPNVRNNVPTARGAAVREIDVVATRGNADPRLNQPIETESKVGKTSDSGRAAQEASDDIRRLADNKAARATGEGLETMGGRLTEEVARSASSAGSPSRSA